MDFHVETNGVFLRFYPLHITVNFKTSPGFAACTWVYKIEYIYVTYNMCMYIYNIYIYIYLSYHALYVSIDWYFQRCFLRKLCQYKIWNVWQIHPMAYMWKVVFNVFQWMITRTIAWITFSMSCRMCSFFGMKTRGKVMLVSAYLLGSKHLLLSGTGFYHPFLFTSPYCRAGLNLRNTGFEEKKTHLISLYK